MRHCSATFIFFQSQLPSMLLLSFDPVCFRELFELMSVPKSQQKADGTDAVSLMELLIHKDNEVKKVLQLGQL